jgi:hypothetical protein
MGRIKSFIMSTESINPIEAVDRKIAHAENAIAECQKQVEHLRLRLVVLAELRSEMLEGNGDSCLGPKDAVVKLCREHPGLPNTRVIELLNGKIRTNATDEKRTIASTIYNLLGANILLRDPDGGLHVGPE